VKLSPRAGVVFSLNDRTVLRGGYGLFWSPWQYAANNSVGYSATTTLQQNTNIPITSIDNPFPNGLTQPTGNALGLASGTSSAISFVDPTRDAPRVHQYSFDVQRELPGDMSVTVGYIGSTGRHLGYAANININQLDPKYLELGNQLTQLVPNPFFGVAGAGSFATRSTIERNQLLRPFPQFDNINMQETTAARSQYHAGVIQLRKRVTGWWGGNASYTYSRLEDNQFGQGNYYTSAPGVLNNYTVIDGSPYFNPDAEYGRSLLDSPHKFVCGTRRTWASTRNSGRAGRAGRRSASRSSTCSTTRGTRRSRARPSATRTSAE
jgi:trimeric autotransporter adhesin